MSIKLIKLKAGNLLIPIYLSIVFSDCFPQTIPFRQTNGPYGGKSTDCIKFNKYDNSIYTIIKSVIYKSSNNGEFWSYYWTASQARDIAFHPGGYIYVICGGYGVYRYSPGDYTWTQIASSIEGTVDGIVINQNGYIFLSASYGIYKSINLGSNFNKISSIPYNHCEKLACHPNGDIYLTIRDEGVIKTTNNGISWKKVSDIHPIQSIGISPDGIIYFSRNAEIYKSTDNGLSWTESYRGGFSFHGFTFNSKNQVFTVSNCLGILSSYTNENNWLAKNEGIVNLRCFSIEVDNNNNLYVGVYPKGIYRSIDDGEHWEYKNDGIFAVVNDIIENSIGNIYALVENIGVFKTENEGENWINIGCLPGQSCITIDDKLNIYIGTTDSGIYKSSDEGETWISVENPDIQDTTQENQSMNVTNLVFNNTDKRLFALINGILCYSDSYGENWSKIDKFLDCFTLNDSGYIFIAHNDSIYISENNQESWISKKIELMDIMNAVKIWADSRGRIFLFIEHEYGDRTNIRRILYSPDWGDTWRVADKGLTNQYMCNVIFTKNGDIYSADDGIYRFIEPDILWKKIVITGCRDWARKFIQLSNDKFVLATGRGVYISENSISDVSKHYLENPQKLYLYQNFPNPFNPTTVIRYHLPKISEVFVRIYNLQGQEIRILVDEKQEAGDHSIEWDGMDQWGKELASGIYFYRIEVIISEGIFLETRKMIKLQ